MKQENRHKNDNDLKKAFDGFSKEPSDKVWMNIQQEINTGSGFSKFSKRWGKGFYFTSVLLITVTAILLWMKSTDKEEQAHLEEDKYSIVDEEQTLTIEDQETTLTVNPEHYLAFETEENNHKDLTININKFKTAEVQDEMPDSDWEWRRRRRKTEANPLLIRNGSFEASSPIPHKNDGKRTSQPWVKLSHPTHWKTGGIPDYYHPKNNRPNMWNNSPKSSHGLQQPHDGQAHIGMILYSQKKYREYRYAELADTLLKGQWYKIEVQIAKGLKGPGVGDFGFYFPEEDIDFNTYVKGDMPIDTTRYTTISQSMNSSTFDHASNWRKATLYYKAKGGETKVYMGSMKPVNEVEIDLVDRRTEEEKEKDLAKSNQNRSRLKGIYTYYFIDNIIMQKAPIRELIEKGLK